VLTGLTISGANTAIHCSGASPEITNCLIENNSCNGIELRDGSNPIITNCEISSNTYYNNAGTNSIQIENDAETITYSDVQCGWPCEGNIDAAPCFAEPGFWNLNGTLDDVTDDYWIPGDYHLRSQAGRWHPGSQSWVLDVLTSPCIDAGNPDSDWITEPALNGDRINMGAYGGTPQASMSFSR
jgi:parallel beta-helix repeat protein